MIELLMGNEAIALGAIKAGVKVVSGYPGTPSTEVLETIAKRNPGNIYVEWSINEKAGLEVAAGAALAGARSMATMKQVGLNVAADPIMCLNYIGVKGGMVIYVGDDPGPISSQTEQDTRHFGKYAKIPVFDPSSPEEAYEMIGEAFEYSEKYSTPVIFRATTRVCHSCASIEVGELPKQTSLEGFVKDSRWVIFPKLAYENKIKIEARENILSDEFSNYRRNEIIGTGKIGIACGGISFSYVSEAIEENEDKFKVMKVATPYPFPENFAVEFMAGLDKIIVFEELDPVIEDALIYICGKKKIDIEILGKRTGTVPNAGELSAMTVSSILDKVCAYNISIPYLEYKNRPETLDRPPVLCAGCPHRASFYAVKQAMKGKKAVFCGDIGCYTLGNAAPLDMVDTCLCMGAGITVAQGIQNAGNDSINFAFVGDSTFFASGITGIINAVYNQTDIVLIILENSTTAMSGYQSHPGMGETVMGEISNKVSIKEMLDVIGLAYVKEINPFDLEQAIEAVKEAAVKKGVRAIVFKSPCISIIKKKVHYTVDHNKCIGCKKCISQLGCPALNLKNDKVVIDISLCNGCGLCNKVCPKSCMTILGDMEGN